MGSNFSFFPGAQYAIAVAAVGFVVAWVVWPSTPSTFKPAPSSKRLKGKKKVTITPSVAPSLPGDLLALSGSEKSTARSHDDTDDQTGPEGKKRKDKKRKSKKHAVSASDVPPSSLSTSTKADAASNTSLTVPVPSGSAAPGQRQRTSPSLTDDGPWTRVENRKKVVSPKEQTELSSVSSSGQIAKDGDPSEGLTTSVTEEELSGAERRDDLADTGLEESLQTLAERLLPKPPKTAVDDMLETPAYPAVARVMRIQPAPDEKPPSGYSWRDYEDVDIADEDADEEDDGFRLVKSRGRKRIARQASGEESGSAVAPKPIKAPDTLNKKERQNTARREAQKEAKADAEKARLETLARYRKEQEKTKIDEQYRAGRGSKDVSGGMTATVTDNAKLVWE